MNSASSSNTARSRKKQRKKGKTDNYDENIHCPRHKGVPVDRAIDEDGNMLSACSECLDKDQKRQQNKRAVERSEKGDSTVRTAKKHKVDDKQNSESVVVTSTIKRILEDGTESEVKTSHTYQMSAEEKVIYDEDERVRAEKQAYIDKLKSGQKYLISSGVPKIMVSKRLDFINCWLNNEFGYYRKQRFQHFLNVNKVHKAIIEHDGRWVHDKLRIKLDLPDEELVNRVLLHLAYEQDLSKMSIVDIKTESATCEFVLGMNTFDIPIELIYYSEFLIRSFKVRLNVAVKPDKALIHHKLSAIAQKEREELEKNTSLSDNIYFAEMAEFWKRQEEPYVSKRKREEDDDDTDDDENSF